MSLDWLTSWMSPSKQNTQDTQKRDQSGQQGFTQGNIYNDPRYRGFFNSYFDQAGQNQPMNEWQAQGLGTLGGATGYLGYGANTSADIAANGIRPDQINKFYNNQVQNVVDPMVAQFQHDNAIQNSQNTAQAARQGALTGSGAGTMRTQTQEMQHRAQDTVVAQQYYKAQEAAQQMAAQENQQRLGAAGQAAQFAGTAGSLGTQQFGAGNTWWNDPWQRQVGMSQGAGQFGTQAGQNTQGTGWGNSSQNTQGWSRDNVSPLQAGSFLASLLPFSDERIKEDIAPIGKTLDGQTIYRFRYKDSPEMHIGLIAQEVARDHPDAVGERDGLLTVDYDAATRDAAAAGADQGGFAFGGGVPGFAYGGGPQLPPWMTGGTQAPNSDPGDFGQQPPLGMPYQPQMPTNAAPGNPLGNPFAPTSPMPNNPMLSKPLGAPMGQPTTMAPALAKPQESSGMMTPPAPPASTAFMPQPPSSGVGVTAAAVVPQMPVNTAQGPDFSSALGATPGLAGGMGKPVSMGGWAEGGVVGDRNGSGDFADKVHRAFRTFHKMRKEAANGGVIEDEQPARYDIGGEVGDPNGAPLGSVPYAGEMDTFPVDGRVTYGRGVPGPGEGGGGMPSPESWMPTVTSYAGAPGAQPAGGQYSFLDRLAKGTAELSRNTGQRTDKPQQGAQQGPGDIKNSSAEALARMMAGLQQRPAAHGGPIRGYADGDRVVDEPAGGGFLSNVWDSISNYAKDPLKGTVYDPESGAKPTAWHNLVRAGMAGSPMAAGVTQNIADQRAADELYTRLKGQLHLPGVGQTKEPSYEAQVAVGKVGGQDTLAARQLQQAADIAVGRVGGQDTLAGRQQSETETTARLPKLDEKGGGFDALGRPIPAWVNPRNAPPEAQGAPPAWGSPPPAARAPGQGASLAPPAPSAPPAAGSGAGTTPTPRNNNAAYAGNRSGPSGSATNPAFVMTPADEADFKRTNPGGYYTTQGEPLKIKQAPGGNAQPPAPPTGAPAGPAQPQQAQPAAPPPSIMPPATPGITRLPSALGEMDYTKTGADAFNQLPPVMQSKVAAALDGRVPPPTGMALKDPHQQTILTAAQLVDPSFDLSKWHARSNARKEFFSSGTKTRTKIESADKVISHISDLDEAIDKLHNTGYPFGSIVRMATNPVLRSAMPNSVGVAFKDFETAKQLAMKEFQTFLSGKGGGADRELQELGHLLSNTASTTELKGVVDRMVKMMHGQLTPMGTTYANAFNLPDYDARNFLTPSTRAKLDKLEGKTGGATADFPLPKPMDQMSLDDINKLPPDKLSPAQFDALHARRKALMGGTP